MSIESYIRSLPKVALHLPLEFAVPKETMLMFANQNEISDEVKRFDKWLALYDAPDFDNLDELRAMLHQWLRYGDDLVRVVYDLGVALSKDNVRYAEVGVNPLAMVSNDLTFDNFLAALSDGRDRVERAWGVQMRWHILIPREEQRRADEAMRWATSSAAKNSGVVAITLFGEDDSVKLSEFERVFAVAQKKEIARVAYLRANDDVDEAIDYLNLGGIISASNIEDSVETLSLMGEQGITLYIDPADWLRRKIIRDLSELPLTTMQEAGVKYVFTPLTPGLHGTTVSDMYLQMIDEGILQVDDVELFISQALEQSHLDDDTKTSMALSMATESKQIRDEHLDLTN